MSGNAFGTADSAPVAGATGPRLKPYQIVGLVLASIGGGMLAWSILFTSAVGDCGPDVGAPPCPDSVVHSFIVMAIAIPVMVIGMILSIGLGVLTAALVGGLTALAVLVLGDAPSTSTAIVVAIVFLGVFGLTILAVTSIYRSAVRNQRKTALFKRHGYPTAGTIVDIADTGVTVNDNPRVRMTVEFRRADGGVERTTLAKVVSRLSLPRVGEQVPVRYLTTGTGTIEALVEWEARQPMPGAVPPTTMPPTMPVSTGSGGPVPVASWSADPAAAPVSPIPPVAPDAGGASIADGLARLAELHRSGALTADEFARAKARLLETGD